MWTVPLKESDVTEMAEDATDALYRPLGLTASDEGDRAIMQVVFELQRASRQMTLEDHALPALLVLFALCQWDTHNGTREELGHILATAYDVLMQYDPQDFGRAAACMIDQYREDAA